jgi:hypothetical protein
MLISAKASKNGILKGRESNFHSLYELAYTANYRERA